MVLSEKHEEIMNAKEQIHKILLNSSTELITIREYLHRHPELSFKEYNTSAFICSKLKEMGVEYQSGIAVTGVIATVSGNNPHSKCIALRADMDALPIQEMNDVSYKSIYDGVMHACGHDVHTTCLLGAAKVLNELKDTFNGTVKLIFQPAEELLPGGASIMIQEGVLRNPEVEKIIALHVFPSLEVGKLGFKSGAYMAACDELYLSVEGSGGHAALTNAYDNPILALAELLPRLNDYVKEESDDQKPYVFSFGKLIADGATNIVPNTAQAEGTFRTMDETWRSKMHQKMVSFVDEFLKAKKLLGKLTIKKGYPNLYNDVAFTQSVKASAIEYFGQQNIVGINKRMTAEDFAYYSQEIPACFFRLGVRNEELGIIHEVHHPNFDVDKDSIVNGAAALAYCTLKEMV
jgi:amidohydrolase